jgi:hypothetical protein
MKYTVQQGDCISSIAFDNGFFWETLWNLSDNADLKALRKNPNVLLAGDVVTIPDITLKQQPCADAARYTFVRKGVPEKLNIQLLDYDKNPRPALDYIIVIDGDARRGKTDATGRIVESIPPSAQKCKLTFAAPQSLDQNGKPVGKPQDQVMILNLGNLNPISEVSGIKARLVNLGFLKGSADEKLTDAAKHAISAFQKEQGLPVTGSPDDATKAQLLKVHGH